MTDKHIPKVVAITGHRNLSAKDRVTIWSSMKTLVFNDRIDELWFGGALGTDTEALKAAIAHRVGSRPKLVVVVPAKVADQPQETQRWIARADQVYELDLEITAKDGYRAYKARNEFLCNHATALLAFWDGKTKSGTGSCVNYAKKIGLKVGHIQAGS